MTTPVVRVGLLLVVGLLAASSGTGQPEPEQPEKKPPMAGFKIPPVRPERPAPLIDTAFPDLKPPVIERKEVKQPDGTFKLVVEEKGAVPLPPLPVVTANDTLLRKVQFEQLQEGLDYLARIKYRERTEGVGGDFLINIEMTRATFRLAAELEQDPAKRVAWLEAQVRAFKEGERVTNIRVLNGSVTPPMLNQIRFERLRAEADLLKLKAEVEKAKK